MSNLKLLIISCLKYSDLWNSYFYFLYKNGSDLKNNFLLVTDFLPNNNNIMKSNIYCLNRESTYAERLFIGLNMIKEKYVLLSMDDYFLDKKINLQDFNKPIKYLEKYNIGYLRLFHLPFDYNKKYIDVDLYMLSYKKEYNVNLYPSIWRKSVLKSVSLKFIKEEPWIFEYNLTNALKKLKVVPYFYNKNIFPFLDVIRKGQILSKAFRTLAKYEITLKKRKKMNFIKEFIINLKTSFSSKLPDTIKIPIRLFLTKILKIKFISMSKNDKK